MHYRKLLLLAVLSYPFFILFNGILNSLYLFLFWGSTSLHFKMAGNVCFNYTYHDAKLPIANILFILAKLMLLFYVSRRLLNGRFAILNILLLNASLFDLYGAIIAFMQIHLAQHIPNIFFADDFTYLLSVQLFGNAYYIAFITGIAAMMVISIFLLKNKFDVLQLFFYLFVCAVSAAILFYVYRQLHITLHIHSFTSWRGAKPPHAQAENIRIT